jgi:hypothetical protein
MFKARQFLKVLEKTKNDEIEIIDKTDYWQIKAGKMTAKINMQTKIDYWVDEIKQIQFQNQEVHPLPNNFYDGLHLCKLRSASSKRGVYVNGNMMISTDEIRLNFYELERSMNCSFWVDDLAIIELLKIKEKMVECSVSDAWVHFKNEEGTLFSCKRNDDSKYPYEKMIEYKNSLKIKSEDFEGFFPDDFKNVIDKIGIMAEQVNGYNAIHLYFSRTGVTIKSSCIIGSIEESLNWVNVYKDDININLIVDFNFLMDVINKCKHFYVKKLNGMNVLVFTNENFVQILSTITE